MLKVLEVAFINTVEADNKRRDLLTRDEHVEERMQTLKDERDRKKEEKAAKEHAAEERRKAAETVRDTFAGSPFFAATAH